MATIRAFRALRPRPQNARSVASVPYDVVDGEEALGLSRDNPNSFLHVIRAEIDLPPGTNPYSEEVYERSALNLRAFIDKGILVEEETPCIYIYRLIMDGREQYGITACCSVDEYDAGLIKKHELTRPEKVDDRYRHMAALSVHAGPVLMTYRGTGDIDGLVSREVSREPLFDFTAPDGVIHTIWRVADYDDFSDAFGKVDSLYIADGHHRSAVASRIREEIRRERGIDNGEDDSDEEYNFFLAVLFPADQMRIFGYNRYVSDLPPTASGLLEKLSGPFSIGRGDGREPRAKGFFGMYLEGSWYELQYNGKRENGNPVEDLDLSLFGREVFRPVFGIERQETDQRIDFYGGPSSARKIEERVDRDGGVGFTFHPVGVSEIIRIADSGGVMPPKSTWFAPKVRSGLLTHRF